MTTVDAAVLSATFRLAGAARTAALIARLPEETARLLQAADVPMPTGLVDHLIAADDRNRLAELAGSLKDGTRDRYRADQGLSAPSRIGTLLRLARMGDPEFGERLYAPEDIPVTWQRMRRDTWRQELRTVVLATADPTDPRWRSPDGLVPQLLNATEPDVLTPALGGPFPDVIRHALEVVGAGMTLPDQFAACQAMLACGGITQLATLAALSHLAEPVRQAVRRAVSASDPAAVLAEAQSADATLVPRLRRGEVIPAAELVAHVDWPSIIIGHRREQLSPGALKQLVTVAGCPPEILVAAYEHNVFGLVRAADDGEDEHVDLAQLPDPLPWTVLTTGRPTNTDDRVLSRLLAHAIPANWFPIDRILAEVSPAYQAINALPTGHEPVRRAISDLARPLGADFATWRALLALLPRFAGPGTDLVAAAVAQAPKHHGKAWPKPLAPEIPAKAPSGGRAAFLRLLAHAEPDVQRSVLPHLDKRAVQQLLIWHDLDDDVVAHAVRTHGVETLRHMAAYSQLSTEKIDYLLSFDDPDINAIIYRHARPSNAQRRRVLAGERHQPGGTDPLPLSDDLIHTLGEITDDARIRRWLLPICWSGHPHLARVLLSRVKLYTPAMRVLLLVRLWERHGSDEVRALLAETTFPGRDSSTHPLPPATHELANAALAAPDGLDLLRTHLNIEWSVAGQVAFLRAQAGTTTERAELAIAQLTRETDFPLPWVELLAAHRNEPLPDALLVVLSKRDDCPHELTSASHPASVRLYHPNYSARRRDPRRAPDATDLLRQYPLETEKPSWVGIALEHGLMTPLDILRHAHPAHHAAAILAQAGPHGQWTAAYREARELVATHLGDDPDAWALAVRLLPGFAGTIPELLVTTAAVVS